MVMQLSETLIQAKQITEEQLQRSFLEVKHQQISWIRALLQETSVDPLYLMSQLAQTLHLSFIDLDTIESIPILIQKFDIDFLQKLQMLPLWEENQKLGVAMSDPTDQLALDSLRFYSECVIEKILVEPKKLENYLAKLAHSAGAAFIEPANTLQTEFAPSALTPEGAYQAFMHVHRTLVAEIENEMVMIEYVQRLLQYAIERQASDIHLEPFAAQLKIRFRIDGFLYPVVDLALQFAPRMITRLKILSQLDIAERRLPQDGRFQLMSLKNQRVDCRLNTCPMLQGEKVVIRILDNPQRLLTCGQLGMDPAQETLFLEALSSPHGMILVTGPTGSGKTMTLYTALAYLNHHTRNISCVENPVEIYLEGINQVNVNPQIGLDFALVLRAFLRQDPDILMVGEMRDQETAEIGIKAAQTGHLVLSTLHTNNAIESLVRLSNMGIPAYNIVSAVYLVIAQRLARCLCLHCKVRDPLPSSILLELGLTEQEANLITLFKAQGCEKCTGGYHGRTGIFELLFITDALKALILQSVSVQEMSRHALAQGMKTLYLSALEKLKQGKISLSEMKRIIKN
jgi:type IV pilus assembly protein PilB